ncbi:uncharacterized protein ACOB8E_006557 [Sarcophilus harrisii]
MWDQAPRTKAPFRALSGSRRSLQGVQHEGKGQMEMQMRGHGRETLARNCPGEGTWGCRREGPALCQFGALQDPGSEVRQLEGQGRGEAGSGEKSLGGVRAPLSEREPPSGAPSVGRTAARGPGGRGAGAPAARRMGSELSPRAQDRGRFKQCLRLSRCEGERCGHLRSSCLPSSGAARAPAASGMRAPRLRSVDSLCLSSRGFAKSVPVSGGAQPSSPA